MEDYFRFSEKKQERFLELVLFAHLATIYSDSHLCEQENILTQKVIEDLVRDGYNRQDIESKVKKIEQYIQDTMVEKTKDFIMLFETSIKHALPPAETELYHRLAHVIMKGACVDDSYQEQERRLFQHFRRAVISVNDEEQKKMDYGVSLKKKEEGIYEDKKPVSFISETEEKKSEVASIAEIKERVKLPGYEFTFVDDVLPGTPPEQHYHQYEQGIPDEIETYEKDQQRAIEMVERIWGIQRTKNANGLKVKHITSLPASFVLQGHIYRLPASGSTEIIIVGDLHGCYNNLKAVLWQSGFIDKVSSGRDIYLVLLGDFFDRGARTLDGIMPLVLKLVIEYPERVIVLRGNHEHFVLNKEGIVESAVRPCETITFWKNYLSEDFFKAYMNFFEQLPLMAFFSNGIVVVHGGIPPAGVLEKIHLLSDFNNLDDLDTKRLRYSVLWTDPGEAEDFPINLKAIFHAPFGKKQFSHFMNKIGARLLVRGHEVISTGCEFTYPGSLITIFSAGGRDNPHAFTYNDVTPRFLRITGNMIEAVKIHWEYFKDGEPA
ncbi:MAG: serine/threonine protein phosphatase [Spirochaetales bacterium]|nr:serine/threonine protein phosphatase [Spirochaetales bacterium]